VAQQPMRSVEERNALVLANLPLALWVLQRRRGLARMRLDPDDAYQEACVGLLLAAERWNPARGAFSTLVRVYAHHLLCRAAERTLLVTLPAYQHYPSQRREARRKARFSGAVTQALAAVFSLDRHCPAAEDNPALARPDVALGVLEDQEECRYLRCRIAGLPLVCQVILRLRFWDGLGRPQVCRRLGLTRGIEARLERQALTVLRRSLGEDYREER
jgi:RNA polymerase sigma factor (sigma-70 family)